MSEIDVGTPAAWVTRTAFGPSQDSETATAGWYVECSRCHKPEHVYRMHLEADPHLLAKRIEAHNRCAGRVAA